MTIERCKQVESYWKCHKDAQGWELGALRDMIISGKLWEVNKKKNKTLSIEQIYKLAREKPTKDESISFYRVKMKKLGYTYEKGSLGSEFLNRLNLLD